MVNNEMLYPEYKRNSHSEPVNKLTGVNNYDKVGKNGKSSDSSSPDGASP